MKDQLCKAFCDNLLVRQVPAGLAVSTGFLDPNGDRIGFYVRTLDQGQYRIEDDGYTLPALEASGLDFSSGSRGEAMDALLSEYGVAIDEEARAFTIDPVSEASLPVSAMRFVAFSLRVRDFALMTEARIVSTFRDDVAKLLRESMSDRGRLEEAVAIDPGLSDFLADFVLRVPGRRPVGVYLATGDAQVLEAILVQMRAIYEIKLDCAVIALLERGRSITSKVRQNASNRLTAVAEFRGDEIASIQRIAHEAFGQSVQIH
jgi:hypothetical protein